MKQLQLLLGTVMVFEHILPNIIENEYLNTQQKLSVIELSKEIISVIYATRGIKNTIQSINRCFSERFGVKSYLDKDEKFAISFAFETYVNYIDIYYSKYLPLINDLKKKIYGDLN